MNRIHENLPSADLDRGDSSNFETASYCKISGLAPTSACRSRGNVATGRFWIGDAPTEYCDECSYYRPSTNKKNNNSSSNNNNNNNDDEPETETPNTSENNNNNNNGDNNNQTTENNNSNTGETTAPVDPETAA